MVVSIKILEFFKKFNKEMHMFIFLSLAIAGFIPLVISFFFSHDVDHDISHHDFGHGDSSHDAGHTISIFSSKVIFTFLMGFGAAGAIGSFYHLGYVGSSLMGVALGCILSGVMYFFLNVISRQQSSSSIAQEDFVGLVGTITTSIDSGKPGEVGLNVNGQYQNVVARAASGTAISKGSNVKVVSSTASNVTVEQV